MVGAAAGAPPNKNPDDGAGAGVAVGWPPKLKPPLELPIEEGAAEKLKPPGEGAAAAEKLKPLFEGGAGLAAEAAKLKPLFEGAAGAEKLNAPFVGAVGTLKEGVGLKSNVVDGLKLKPFSVALGAVKLGAVDVGFAGVLKPEANMLGEKVGGDAAFKEKVEAEVVAVDKLGI